ncbi:MAG TPA: TraU family protein, partial [Rickettsia endosymbiont of Omalisus fontisbellaquei]|nr:TraU family protein [Rickettsia endosymbiont of Omalisus fontisbellaquei]
PITIGGVKIAKSNMPDTHTPRSTICFCAKPNSSIPSPGMPVSFWEPVRLVDVTKSPMCMVSLGGISFGDSQHKGIKDDKDGEAFFHVHWYTYPVIYWLEILLDFACLEKGAVDVAYLTEFDPLWGDDAKSSILNPEGMLFGNIAAQSACVGECLTASLELSNDKLFWCSGCQGGLYPFTGTTPYHNSGVGTSLLITAKFMAKLHRELLLWGYIGKEGLCGKYPMPIMKKSQYRLQMTYPIPETVNCKRIGQTEVFWYSGKEFPVRGEDFGYLIWRKRDCCLQPF